TMPYRSTLRLALVTTAATAVVATGAVSGAVQAATSGITSAGAAACASGGGTASAARVRPGATAQEPELYSPNEANAYGVIKDSPRLPNGSVTVPTVFHMISDHPFSTAEKNRWTTL